MTLDRANWLPMTYTVPSVPFITARQARGDIEISVVLANREYESWFLAAASSLAGQHGFPVTMTAPSDPDNPRDAKGWLTRQRGRQRPYKGAVDSWR